MEDEITKQQIPVLAARLVEFQEAFSSMPKKDGQWVIQNTSQAIELFIAAVKNRELLKKESPILRLISGGEKIIIEALDGKATIADSRDIFKSHVDPDFVNWRLNDPGLATFETLIDVYEMVRPASFTQIFSGLNTDLNKLVLTQHQIIRFCAKHPTWLRREGNATLFLIKVNGEYFVADVYVNSDGLYVHVYRFGHGHVWSASGAHRIVVPQLAPLTI